MHGHRQRTHAAGWDAVAAGLLVLHAVLAWIARAPMMLTGQDDARYLGLARAIRMGAYRDFMWPGAPLHHMYPPGYPALLALWTAIGGEGFAWIIVLQVLMSVTTLALTYLAARRSIDLPVALGTLAVLSVNPSLLEAAGQVMSEVSLALVVALAVWASVCMARGTRQSVVLLVLALAAPMMRTAGVVLPAALVLHWLLQRRYRDAAVAALVSALVVGALLWWTFTDPNAIAGSSYAGDLTLSTTTPHAVAAPPSMVGELLRRVQSNLVFYPTRGLPWILPVPALAGTAVDNAVSLAGIVLGLCVGLWAAYRRWPLAVLVVACTGALVLVWPYQVERYLVPVLPVLVAVLLLGLVTAAGVLRVPAWVTVVLAALVVTGTGLSRSLDSIARGRACEADRAAVAYNCESIDQAAFFRAAAFVRDSIPRAARVLSAKSEPLHLASGHVTEPLARVARLDSATFWGTLQRDSVTYILLGELQGAERPLLAPQLLSRCRELELVRTFTPRLHLLRLADAGAPPATPACDAIARYRALRPRT